jgi:DNA-nicking Smr family endonuclease
MKKKKKTEQKKKEFIHAPFNSLKGFVTESTENVSKPAEVVKPDKSAGEEDDDALFLRSVADVKRISPVPPSGKPAKAAPSKPRKIDEEERRVFLQSLEKMDVIFRDEIPDVEPLRPVAINRMRQLKSGAIRIDFELDLHGLTREEALESLKHFIAGAFNRGQKAVLVITGKGNNSPGEPVLLGAVVSWLRENGKTMVAEFAPAPQQMGGGGALVVFLKDKNKIKGPGGQRAEG